MSLQHWIFVSVETCFQSLEGSFPPEMGDVGASFAQRILAGALRLERIIHLQKEQAGWLSGILRLHTSFRGTHANTQAAFR